MYLWCRANLPFSFPPPPCPSRTQPLPGGSHCCLRSSHLPRTDTPLAVVVVVGGVLAWGRTETKRTVCLSMCTHQGSIRTLLVAAAAAAAKVPPKRLPVGPGPHPQLPIPTTLPHAGGEGLASGSPARAARALARLRTWDFNLPLIQRLERDWPHRGRGQGLGRRIALTEEE